MPSLPPPVPTSARSPAIIITRSVTYQVTRLDIFVSSLTVLLRNRLIQMMIVACFCFDLFVSLTTNSNGRTAKEVVTAVSVKFFWLLLVSQGWVLLCALFSAFISKRQGVICQHTLGITDQGLLEQTHVNETIHPWKTVGRVFSLFNAVYIYVSAFNAHVVPKREVSTEELKEFLGEVRKRASNARNSNQ